MTQSDDSKGHLPMPVPGPGVAGDSAAYPIDDYGDLGKLTWLAFKVGDLERRFALPRDRYVTDEDIAEIEKTLSALIPQGGR
jgi:hypothetical protein